MKTIEQKAIAYDKAIEKIKYVMDHGVQPVLNKEDLLDIFTELKEKENEDEKLREQVVYAINQLHVCECTKTKLLACLEKQGEHKLVDKIETRFKVGDYVVDNCGYIWRIEGVINQFYVLEGVDGGESRPTIEWVNNTFHHWTILDAKDGDVLAAHECLVLFREIDGLNIRCYCTYHFMNNPSFHVDTLQNKDAFHPATREQHDQLEKAMADAGYTFDKKELKDIKQNHAWSEEDENRFSNLIYLVEHSDEGKGTKEGFVKFINWLKERYAWKPSKEQMQQLGWIAEQNKDNMIGKELMTLYNDLKKLKG